MVMDRGLGRWAVFRRLKLYSGTLRITLGWLLVGTRLTARAWFSRRTRFVVVQTATLRCVRRLYDRAGLVRGLIRLFL